MVSVPKYTGFRLMEQCDVPDVFDIDCRVYKHPWTEGIFSDCLRVGHLCLLYEEQGILTSYGIAALHADEAHILNVSVVGLLQGRGYGRAMLRKLLELVQEAGAVRVLLEVRASNEIAIALYKSEGFVEIGLRKGYYPDDQGREDAIVFAKDLT